jgi:light-regulated signal transduction histidine kinase (bacteriophytochrome)
MVHAASAQNSVQSNSHQPGWVDPNLQATIMSLRKAASTLAHDMRNPLTLVLTVPDLLHDVEGMPSQVTEKLDIIKVRLLCQKQQLFGPQMR